MAGLLFFCRLTGISLDCTFRAGQGIKKRVKGILGRLEWYWLGILLFECRIIGAASLAANIFVASVCFAEIRLNNAEAVFFPIIFAEIIRNIFLLIYPQ
jgi:hypothetical protein